MRLQELRVIFDADNVDEVKKELIDMFYEFGIQGIKIDEPLTKKNALDFYKDEKVFLMKDHGISAYFPMNKYVEKRKEIIRKTLEERFEDREDIIYTLDFYDLDEDYENNWKKHLFPEKISERFVVKPTWREYEGDEGELVIELDPGRAFGTGSHPTTSLTLRGMERHIKDGDTLLDVGTGSGILMVAGAKLGASKVVGVDIDDAAVEASISNLELNNIDLDRCQVLKGDLLDTVKEEKYDVVVANILADVLLLLLEDISKVVKKGGIIILSGIIEAKLWEVRKKGVEFGFEVVEEESEKEWRSLILKNV